MELNISYFNILLYLVNLTSFVQHVTIDMVLAQFIIFLIMKLNLFLKNLSFNVISPKSKYGLLINHNYNSCN